MVYEIKSTIKITIFVCVLSACIALFSGVSYAADPQTCEQGNAAACLNSASVNPIMGLIVTAINFLAAAVGIVAVIMLIVAGIQYSAAGDKPDAVQAAKQKIYNVLFGLAAFFLLYSFIQWLIPGGIGF